MTDIGLVLAGGSSRRMGRDKATLVVDGKRLVDRAVAKLRQVVETVAVADRGRNLIPGLSLKDGAGRGPAAGLLGAACRFPSCSLLVLACDLPEVPPELLRRLLDERADLVLPTTARGHEPLCAVYRPRALAALQARVAGGRFSLHPLAEHPELEVALLGDELAPWGPPERVFRNLNSPADLE